MNHPLRVCTTCGAWGWPAPGHEACGFCEPAKRHAQATGGATAALPSAPAVATAPVAPPRDLPVDDLVFARGVVGGRGYVASRTAMFFLAELPASAAKLRSVRSGHYDRALDFATTPVAGPELLAWASACGHVRGAGSFELGGRHFYNASIADALLAAVGVATLIHVLAGVAPPPPGLRTGSIVLKLGNDFGVMVTELECACEQRADAGPLAQIGRAA